MLGHYLHVALSKPISSRINSIATSKWMTKQYPRIYQFIRQRFVCTVWAYPHAQSHWYRQELHSHSNLQIMYTKHCTHHLVDSLSLVWVFGRISRLILMKTSQIIHSWYFLFIYWITSITVVVPMEYCRQLSNCHSTNNLISINKAIGN